jgi:hypothetical protein
MKVYFSFQEIKATKKVIYFPVRSRICFTSCRQCVFISHLFLFIFFFKKKFIHSFFFFSFNYEIIIFLENKFYEFYNFVIKNILLIPAM